MMTRTRCGIKSNHDLLERFHSNVFDCRTSMTISRMLREMLLGAMRMEVCFSHSIVK